ncbi:protein translocase subunit SecD, partial [Neisseria bacilliformis]|uniref:protein translocase subunit SecD n=1 Tax=Neisseria bacilliformis TaxID=267212 RepID=UPI0028E396DA
MNRYPLWKYLLVTAVLALGLLYTLPNFFGDTLAVQISTNRHSLAIDSQTEARVAQALKTAGIADDGMFIADGSLKVRFKDSQTQMKARSVIESALGEGYITALNQIANTPDWMAKIRANPMFLGLDLRGGVHFTMQVDMKAAMQKTFERYAGDIRRELAKQKIRSGQAVINDNSLSIPFQDAAELENVLPQLQRLLPEATLTTDGSRLVLTLSEQALANIRKQAVEQNITTLHNRVNELGVAEPVIQQAGADRIAVQLPGVQDTAKAKDIIGRTATLEVRMVNEDQAALQAALDGNVPEGYELLKTAGDRPQPLLISKQVELTGDNIDDAQPGQNDKGLPGVNVSFDNIGAEIFADLTRNNVGKRMAMVLVEQGKAEIVTAPSINEPIPNGKTIISGSMSLAEAQDISLLLRAGSLAAPMEIVEERTIGASLGAENIQKGVHSTLWGFAAVAVFMMFYYRLMGFFSVLALAANILLLVAALSFLHATLTLPGIAAMALTLGMAIDSNVLINERIREELRDGMKPQAAIAEGYKHAWDTIVDSNITSLIAGIALLLFGSGP